MENVRVDIVEYQPIHQPSFEKLNRQWIEQFFWMEPIDYEVLQKPDQHIIATGGAILMAEVDCKVAGTVALKLSAPGVYEFTKMAVDERYRGKQIGKKLGEAAIRKATSLGASKIILYSNTILAPAIKLYRKLGFKEVPVDGPYRRSNIKMELKLKEANWINPRSVNMRIATASDVPILASLGRETFSETFSSSNTEENMRLYIEKTFSEETIAVEWSNKSNVFFLAEIGNCPIGYAKLSKAHKPAQLVSCNGIELERLYVKKDAIGKGVGQSLMQKCIEYARTHGHDVMWLGVWENNTRALTFYNNFGFERFSEHIFMLGNDQQTDFLLKKQL